MALANLQDLTDDEDFLELVEMELNQRVPRIFRQRPSNFEIWRDNEFLNRFRFSKPVVQFLIEKLNNNLAPVTRRYVEYGQKGGNVISCLRILHKQV